MLAKKPYIKPCIYAIEATPDNAMLAASEGGEVDYGYSKHNYYFEEEAEYDNNVDNWQINNTQIPNDWNAL